MSPEVSKAITDLYKKMAKLEMEIVRLKREPQQEPKQYETLEQRISRYLQKHGVRPHLKGYRFLRTAIELAYEDESLTDSVTKVLYPKIANVYKATSENVERNIRHAIESAWIKHNFLPWLPTNSEFIAMAAENLRLENIQEKQEAKE